MHWLVEVARSETIHYCDRLYDITPIGCYSILLFIRRTFVKNNLYPFEVQDEAIVKTATIIHRVTYCSFFIVAPMGAHL